MSSFEEREAKRFSDRYFSNTFAERLQKLNLTDLNAFRSTEERVLGQFEIRHIAAFRRGGRQRDAA